MRALHNNRLDSYNLSAYKLIMINSSSQKPDKVTSIGEKQSTLHCPSRMDVCTQLGMSVLYMTKNSFFLHP